MTKHWTVLVRATLVSELKSSFGILVVPEPYLMVLLEIGAISLAVAAVRLKLRKSSISISAVRFALPRVRIPCVTMLSLRRAALASCRITASMTLFCATFVVLPPTALAGLVTVPPGLHPGDQYRLAFVTSNGRDAKSANIADYNAFVTTTAMSIPELAALGTTWSAIASANYPAMANTATNPLINPSHAIYRLDGIRIVSSYTSLWDGDLDAAISVTENGTFNLGEIVYTGSDNNGYGTYWSLGNLGDPPNDIPSYYVSAGITVTDHRWIYGGPVDGSTYAAHLYAISGVLTVVPVLFGDYSGNGTVGPEDYNLWKANFGSTNMLAADGNGDGIIDAADYSVWRDHLGQSAGAGSLTSGTVPEPSTLLLLVAGTLAMCVRRRATAS